MSGVNTPYGTLKAAWHIDRIATIRKGKQAAPVSLQLILSDLCNHSCAWCAYRADNGFSSQNFGGLDKNGNFTMNPNRMITTEKAKEIITDAKALGVKSITFTGGGEPTVHPDHIEIFKFALDLGFDCSLNTNGNLLRKGWEEVLPRFTYIRFSIDGGDAALYAKERSVSLNVYDKVNSNLSKLASEIKKRNSSCVISSGYVITKENYKHLKTGITKVRDAGAAYVRLASFQSTEGFAVYGDELDLVRKEIEECKTLETDNFKIFNIFDVAMGQKMDDPFCGFQQLVMYIGADLKVYRCCYVAYTDLGEVGSLADKRLIDWFNSPEKEAAYHNFDARSCNTCPLADKNRVITYMVNTEPTHINFI